MHLRPVTVSLLLLGTTAIAQAQNPILPAPAPSPAPAKPAGQDPDKKQQSPEQTIQELTNERDRLAREIAYAKDHAKNVKVLLAEKLGAKKPAWKSIDAGTSSVGVFPVQPMTPRQARIATPEELNAQGPDTLLVVNGHGVSQRAFENMMNYLATYPASGDEATRSQIALDELIKLEAIAATLGENESLERVADIYNQLEKGKSMAELAKSVGSLPGANAEGKVDVTRNSTLGPMFEQMAFGTEVGQRTRPFRHPTGLVILQVDKVAKGDAPASDKVTVSGVVVPFTPDTTLLQKAHNAVNEGQVDVWVKDQKTLDMLPIRFRRPAPVVMTAPLQSPEVAAVQKQIQDLMKELGTLQGKTDEASKTRMQELARAIGEAETKLRTLRAAQAGATGDADAVRAPDDVNVLNATLGQLAAQIAELEKEGSDAAKEKLKVLNEQYTQIKLRLKRAQRGSDGEAPTEIRGDGKPPAKKN